MVDNRALVLLLGAAALALGCSGTVNSQKCDPGTRAPCTCADGADGERQCRADGSYGSCTCGGGADAGGQDAPAPGDAGSDTAGDGPAGTDGGADATADTEPLGDESLLPGMTPADYQLPDGWTLLRTQDMEGTCPAEEWCGGYAGSITTTRPHTGAKSIEGTYAYDQADVGWTLEEGHVGSFSDLYLSFYEYLEPQALFNDEFFLAHFIRHAGNDMQEVVFDWYWAPGFNQPAASLYVVPQGVVTARFAGTQFTVPKGAWVQWEVWLKPNTLGNGDGFARVYKDGTLYISAEDVELSGLDLADCRVQAGGLYTKLVWMKDYPTCDAPSQCSDSPGEGTDACTAAMDWWGQSFSNPICGPPLPSFRRFVDDIIVMKR